MKIFDVITVGSVTQDTYVSCSDVRIMRLGKQGKKVFSFPYGTKLELHDMQMEVGGGATNAAATFSRLGLSVSIVAECGADPSGEYAVNELQKEGIETKYIQSNTRGRTAYSVIFLGPKGDRTIFVYRGVDDRGAAYSKVLQTIQTRWVYMSSVGGNTTVLRTVFKIKDRGVNIAWNPGKKELQLDKKTLSSFLKKTDVLLVNKEEYALLTKKKVTVPETVVVSRGSDGSQLYAGKTKLRTRIRPVASKDTTGAGDAFGSGFIAGLLKKPGDFSYALTLGSANAMSVVQKVGAKHGLLKKNIPPSIARRISIH